MSERDKRVVEAWIVTGYGEDRCRHLFELEVDEEAWNYMGDNERDAILATYAWRYFKGYFRSYRKEAAK